MGGIGRGYSSGMTMSSLALRAATLGCAAILTTACSVSANLTVPASTIAQQAEEALEQQVGGDAEVDCGSEDVDLVNGTTVDCVLTDLTTGSKFDTVVTISQVDGTDYHIDAEVSDEAQ